MKSTQSPPLRKWAGASDAAAALTRQWTSGNSSAMPHPRLITRGCLLLARGTEPPSLGGHLLPPWLLHRLPHLDARCLRRSSCAERNACTNCTAARTTQWSSRSKDCHNVENSGRSERKHLIHVVSGLCR